MDAISLLIIVTLIGVYLAFGTSFGGKFFSYIFEKISGFTNEKDNPLDSTLKKSFKSVLRDIGLIIFGLLIVGAAIFTLTGVGLKLEKKFNLGWWN